MTTRLAGFGGMLLLALLAVLVVPPPRIADAPPLSGPGISERDRELVRAVEGALANPRPFTLEGEHSELIPVAGLTPVDVPNLPDFPDVCRTIALISGQPCVWRVEHGVVRGHRIISVWLESNGRVYGLAEYYEASSWEVGLDEALGINEAIKTPFVWRGSIHVLDGLQRLGLGTTLWQAGDRVIQFLIGSGAVRVFIDKTATPETAGWGAALFRNFAGVVQQISYNTWIYRIP